MTFQELQRHFLIKGFKFNRTVVLKKDTEVVEGLWIYCNPILKDSRMKVVEDNLPPGFYATWLPNLSEIHIKKSK